MLKNISAINIYIRNSCILFLFISSCCYAEIYKWTDANGQIHYSDNKKDIGKSKAKEFKINHSLNLIPKVTLPNSKKKPDYLQSKQQKIKPVASKSKKNKKWSGDYRCILARQIVDGNVRLRNGLSTGEYEIKVAKRDIRKFCN